MASTTILAWNCRGLSDYLILAELKKLIQSQRPHLTFLSETKRSMVEIQRIQLELVSYCSLVDSIGRSGGLATLWTNEVHINLLSYPQSHRDMEIKDTIDLQWRVMGIYGSQK